MNYVYQMALSCLALWGPEATHFYQGEDMGKPKEKPMTDQQTPEDEQDLTEDPIEAMLREPGTREGGLPPAPVVNKEWAEAKQKSARAALRPTELQIRLLHYGKLSGGLMSDELQRIKAENGEKETTDALEKLMNHGLLDRGHVITDKGKAALLGLNPE